MMELLEAISKSIITAAAMESGDPGYYRRRDLCTGTVMCQQIIVIHDREGV